MNILAHSLDDGAQGHYRTIWPIGYLHEKRVAEAKIYYPILRNNSQEIEWADIIILQHITNPSGLRIIENFKKSNKKVVYETDDDMLNLPKDHPSFNYYNDNAEITKEIFKTVDLVTTTTESLANTIRPFAKQVAVFPNCIPLELIPIKKYSGSNVDINILLSTNYYHNADIDMISDVLIGIIRRYANVKLFINSVGFPPSIRKIIDSLSQRNITFIGKLPFSEYHAKLKEYSFDIGLAPLVRNKFNESKSSVKFIDYTVIGAVTLASWLPPYQSAIEDGVNGFLARNREDWETKLSTLINCINIRKELHHNATQTIIDKYSLENNYLYRHKIYKSIL